MEPEITDIQHPNAIWTWKESSRGQRQSLWIPYLQNIEKKPKSKNWLIQHNGGNVEVNLKTVDFIMLYGAVGDLPIAFLDDLNTHRICLVVHRRNMPRPYIFIPASGADEDDLLSAQIIARENSKTAAYVARTLIREKLLSVERTAMTSLTDYKRLSATRNVDQVRAIEATAAIRYWTNYFGALGLSSDVNRREMNHSINTAIDAGSYFLHGIMLRWVLFHKLSPFHGYLHTQTTYPSLIYDLMEPYRYLIDESASEAFLKVGNNEDQLTPLTIEILKGKLEEPVFVPVTHQTVRTKSLLHGAVLSLRAWLLGKQTRFVLPVAGEKKGGRPPNIGFSIPGYNK